MWSKGNDFTTSNGEVSYGLLSRTCFYCTNLMKVAPLQLEIKSFVKVKWLWGNGITTSLGWGLNWTLSMRFTWCPNLMFLASPWFEMYRLSNWSFSWFEQFKVDSHSACFRQVKTDPTCLSTWLGAGQLSSENTHRIWRKLFVMIQSAGIKTWVSQLISRLQSSVFHSFL